MGKLIVMEGLDGSGKQTQTRRQYERLADELHQKVRMVSFPNYQSPASGPLKMYLGGTFGERPDDVNAYAASVFFAIDRFASFRQDWQAFYENGGLVLADRYSTSNVIHQCAKLPPEQWAGFVDWLQDFEYTKLGIPAPDAVIYLDVPVEISQQLLAGRYGGDEARKDIHERDANYLQACRAAALWCAGRMGWHTVSCAAEGELRDVEDISAEITHILGGILA